MKGATKTAKAIKTKIKNGDCVASITSLKGVCGCISLVKINVDEK